MSLDITKLRPETLAKDIETYTRLVTVYGIQGTDTKNHLRALKEEQARRTRQQ